MGEPAQELGVVVVEPEREAHVIDAGFALGRDDDRAVGALDRVHALESVAGPHGGAVGAADDDPGRIATRAGPESRSE